MQDAAPILLIVLLFITVFPLFWLIIVWMIGQIGGWQTLARHFRTTRTPTGDHFSWKSAQLGWLARYRNALNLWVDDEGLFMQPTIFFRVNHPLLLIPWHQIERFKHRRVMLVEMLVCTIRLPDGRHRRLTLFGKDLIASVQRHAGRVSAQAN